MSLSSSPVKFAIPDFSDYSDDDPEDYAILFTYADFLLSIESATLQMIKPSRADRPLKIYGDIHIGGGLYGKAFTVYHRTSDDPQTISPETHYNLTLCGPRYSMYAKSPEILYVDLYDHEDGSSLINTRVPYDRFVVNPQISSFQLCASSNSNDCVLKICMTALATSVATRTELELVGSGNDRWFVSGTVSAVQTVVGEEGEIRRNVALFGRAESEPVRIDGRVVPLDREVAVTPIHIDEELVQRAYDLTLEAGGKPPFEPADPVHGKGSSLVIEVDLKATGGSGDCVVLKGAPKFELKGSHMVGRTYDGHIAGAPKRKGQAKSVVGEKHMCTGTSSVGDSRRVEVIESFTIDGASHELAIKVSVTHFNNYSCGNLDDEVFEEKLPLYQSLEVNTAEEEEQQIDDDED